MIANFFYMSRIHLYTKVYRCHLKVNVNDFIGFESGNGHHR